MWIIPKNKELSAYVQDTGESNWDSKELAQYLERSVMWRSKPSRWQTWLQRLKKVSWMQRLSGRILRPSMDALFEEKYTASLEVIPASRSVAPENEKEQTTPDTFGRILLESCRQLDLFGASLKTSPDTLPLDSLKFTEAYEIWVTKLRLDSLVRLSAALTMKDKDFIFLPTPRAFIGMSFPMNQIEKTLHRKYGATNLEDKICLLMIACGVPRENMFLNPEFVEEMMGIKAQWTDFDYWETE